MNWLRNWLKHRAERRYAAWIKRNRIVFTKPRADERNWSGAYMRSLR